VSKSPRFGDTWASVLLDLLRGIAALMVLGDHWRNFFFVDFPEVRVGHRWALIPAYIVTTAGHQAVVIFFLLSGLLISTSVFRMLRANQWTWRVYATHRLLRLWIVLVPGLLLCTLWDGLGVCLHVTRALYFGNAANHLMHDVAYQLKPSYFFGNLFFLQGKSVPTFGSDTALWSLANEFWYYALFPLALVTMWKGQRPKTRVFCAFLFLMICWWLRGSFLPLFPIWLMGAAVSQLPRLPVETPIRWLLVGLYVPLVLTFAIFRGAFSLLLSDYLLTIATATLLWTVMSATSEAPRNRTVRAIRYLAGGSFSLYVLHMPIFAILAAYFVGNARWQPTVVHILAAGTILACTIIYCFIVAHFTEFRTDAVRRWLELRYPSTTRQQKTVP
jgi:peptidoglycan/LPS O-acetylase OafA/YrhL